MRGIQRFVSLLAFFAIGACPIDERSNNTSHSREPKERSRNGVPVENHDTTCNEGCKSKGESKHNTQMLVLRIAFFKELPVF